MSFIGLGTDIPKSQKGARAAAKTRRANLLVNPRVGYYTRAEAAQVAGIKRIRLHHWERAGLLIPGVTMRGQVKERAYTRSQVLGLIAMGDLLRGKVSERTARPAVATLPMEIEAKLYLAFDGRVFYQANTAEATVKMQQEWGGLGRVWEVASLAERLDHACGRR